LSEYAGRITVGSIVALVVVVGLGFELSNFSTNSPSSSTTTSTSSASTIVASSSSLSGSSACWAVIYNQTDGSIYSLGQPCGVSSPLKGLSSINVTSGQAVSIMTTNGWTNAFYVNLTSKQLTQIPGVTFSNNYQHAFYNGQPIINGTRLPTPYVTTTSSTVTSSGKWCTYLDGVTHYLQNPLPSGPIYIKVMTDQGALVTNGTVYASNRVNVTSWWGSDDYCVYLSSNTNSTGFEQVTENLYPNQGGVYNFTVVAQYGANQSSKVVIHDIVVQTNTTTYIAISIPSGQVTIATVTCNQPNSCTESSSTTSAKGG
jgi:hypothetical protein